MEQINSDKSTLWQKLKEKGKISTLIGLLFTLPAFVFFCFLCHKYIWTTQPTTLEQLYPQLAIVFTGSFIGITFIILPSKIEISKNGFIAED